MKIHDISMTIHDSMSVWDNKDTKKPKFVSSFNYQTSNVYETTLTMDMHLGTHIDAPLHMIKDGNKIEAYHLNQFITECHVLDFTNIKGKITATDLRSKELSEGEFVLLKTINSNSDVFQDDFIYLDQEGTEYLVNKRIKGVGIDGLGIERSQEGFPTHISLLTENIVIIEGLRLSQIKEGNYLLIALPLKIKNVEAAPCRAILIER